MYIDADVWARLAPLWKWMLLATGWRPQPQPARTRRARKVPR